ncbi:MAG: hypothetical protein SF339_18315 [Blastocatellia bacterium]|nr:hypothetical protein [Blastocatellia bacterium]
MSEPTTRAAAKAAGVSEATIWRWLSEPGFAAAHQEARGRLLEGVLTRLQAVAGDAVSTLADVMADPNAGASARVSAARAVLEMALRAKAELEIENRLRTLEQAAATAAQRKVVNL